MHICGDQSSSTTQQEHIDPHMHDAPKDIAEYLIQEHGLDGALAAAIEGAILAQQDGDNYALSIWREIKAVIRHQLAERSEEQNSTEATFHDIQL